MNPQKAAGLAILLAVLLPFLARCEQESVVMPKAGRVQSADEVKKVEDELRELREHIRKRNETKDAAAPSATKDSEHQKKPEEPK
jgi:hypothetical protein